MKLVQRRVKMIWDQAKHNAFTSLARFQDRWYCAFREGEGHVSLDGKIRVLTSADAESWSSASLLESPGKQFPDLRDPKLTLTPDGRLMLTAGASFRGETSKFQTFAWFTADGTNWTDPHEIGPLNEWLWAVTWHEKRAYSVGYRTNAEAGFAIRLYQSDNGINFDDAGEILSDPQSPSESALHVLPDGMMLSLTRREYAPGQTSAPPWCLGPALLGCAKPPYSKWDWKDLGFSVIGPTLLALPDGRILAAGKMLRHERARTAVGLLDIEQKKLTPLLWLPSDGDNSYPGMVYHADRLWVSYYSSKNEKADIYLATIEISN